jgi:hypothetical protein
VTFRLFLTICGCSVLVGCEADQSPGSGLSIRDSSGVSLVDLAERAPDVWTLAEEPLWELGAEEGPQALFRVSSAFQVEDGRVFVANSGTAEVRVFGPGEEFLYSFGGRGDGPGEFSGLDWMTRLGPDSLAVLDVRQGRVSGFSFAGEVLWTQDLTLGAGHPLAGDFYAASGVLLGVWNQGNLFEKLERGSIEAGRTARSDADVYNVSRGTSPSRLATVSGLEEAISRVGDDVALSVAPFARTTVFVAARDRIFVGDQALPEVVVLAPGGRLIARIRLPEADLSIGPTDVDDFKRAVISSVGGDAETQTRTAEWVDGLPLPPTKPAFGELRLDQEERLWISEAHHWGEAPGRWTILDLRRELQADLAVPSGVEILWANGSNVIGKRVSALGVEYLQLYELRGGY